MFGWKKKGRKTAPPMAVYAGPEYFERRSKKNGEESPEGNDGADDIPVPEPEEDEPREGCGKKPAKEKRELRKKYPNVGKNQSLCNDVYGGPDMIDDEPVEEPVEDQND